MGDHVISTHEPSLSALREIARTISRPAEPSYPQTRKMEKLAQRLKRLRKAARLTQPQLAKAAKVPASTIAEIETGTTQNPTFDTLKKLAAFFDVNEEWLQYGRGAERAVSSMRDEESELILLFRSLSAPGKDYFLSRLRDMHADEHRGRSPAPPASPDETAPKPRKPQH